MKKQIWAFSLIATSCLLAEASKGEGSSDSPKKNHICRWDPCYCGKPLPPLQEIKKVRKKANATPRYWDSKKIFPTVEESSVFVKTSKKNEEEKQQKDKETKQSPRLPFLSEIAEEQAEEPQETQLADSLTECEPEYCYEPDPCCGPSACSEPISCCEVVCCKPIWCDFITIDFLYWYATETNLPYAQRIQVKNQVKGAANDEDATFVFAPKSIKNFKTTWDPGVRIGRGWNTNFEGWDLYLVWTYFKDNDQSCDHVGGFSYGNYRDFPGFEQQALINPWVNPVFSPTDDPNDNQSFLFDTVIGDWKILFNSIDFEFGRTYFLSHCFELRTYSGIRGAWIHTKFRTKSIRRYREIEPDNTTGTEIIFKDRFKNRNWGVGLIGGMQPNWYFNPCFSLFGNFEVALLWGKAEMNKNENYQDMITDNTSYIQRINYKNKSENDKYRMYPNLDLAIGLRWEKTWGCERAHTALDLGWEQHFWYDMNHRYRIGSSFAFKGSDSLPKLSGYSNVQDQVGNLMFGGLTVRLRIDF